MCESPGVNYSHSVTLLLSLHLRNKVNNQHRNVNHSSSAFHLTSRQKVFQLTSSYYVPNNHYLNYLWTTRQSFSSNKHFYVVRIWNVTSSRNERLPYFHADQWTAFLCCGQLPCVDNHQLLIPALTAVDTSSTAEIQTASFSTQNNIELDPFCLANLFLFDQSTSRAHQN